MTGYWKKVNIVIIVLLFLYSGVYSQPEQTSPSTGPDTTAQALWKWYFSTAGTGFKVTAEDSIEALKKLVLGNKLTRQATDATAKRLDDINKGQEPTITTSEIIALFENAKNELESSLRLNPRDERTAKILQSIVYSRLLSLYDNEKNIIKEVEILETLILQDDPKSTYFYKLGNCYFTLNNWKKARYFCNRAIEIELQKQESEMDSSVLLYSYWFRGDAEIKLNFSFEANESFEAALKFSPNEDWTKRIQSRIVYIQFDGGNLEISKELDEVRKLELSKNYEKAHDGYLALLPNLTTENAKKSINLKIANLDFWRLDKKEDGIQRLYDLMKHINIDSNGVAADSSFNVILESYGRMCNALGAEYYKSGEHKFAYIYFYQATAFNWSGKGQSYLRLAGLSQDDASQAIYYCQKALDCHDELSENDQKQLYQHLFRANRNAGNFDDAEKWYIKFLQL